MRDPARRFALRLEFDGSEFCGWQSQSKTMERAGRPSIQTSLQKCLQKLLGTRKPIHVQGCGRTDAGVHAEDFVAHVDIESAWLKNFRGEPKRLRLGLNSISPASLAIKEVAEVDPAFHALEDVTTKVYEYRLLIKMTKPALERGRVYWIAADPLNTERFDLALLRAQLQTFVGTRDFAAFANAGHSVKSTVRTLLGVTCEDEMRDRHRGRLVRIFFEGEGFLKQQVRNMVGALVAVALQKRGPAFIPSLLDASDGPATRIPGLFCAPPEGLFLVKVNYDRSIFPAETSG